MNRSSHSIKSFGIMSADVFCSRIGRPDSSFCAFSSFRMRFRMESFSSSRYIRDGGPPNIESSGFAPNVADVSSANTKIGTKNVPGFSPVGTMPSLIRRISTSKEVTVAAAAANANGVSSHSDSPKNAPNASATPGPPNSVAVAPATRYPESIVWSVPGMPMGERRIFRKSCLESDSGPVSNWAAGARRAGRMRAGRGRSGDGHFDGTVVL
mmetsp:Transcript_833/g.2427  ORF Transcript_833/g.2427 Transcript_833/m.2427 type:complete len:211 (+) Transcript_833:1231-1863(+)